MLTDRPEEQKVLFQDIVLQKMSVRDAELAARRIAIERVRKFDASLDPEISDLEEKFTESLGTRVKIEKKDNGGKLMIEFFSNEDLHDILNMLNRDSVLVDDRSPEETKIAEETPILDKLEAEAKEEEDLYSIKNFSV